MGQSIPFLFPIIIIIIPSTHPPQVQAITLISPLFSPTVATALSSPLSTRESVPSESEIPAGSHAQQWYRYHHHDGFLIGPTVIQNRDFSLRWSEWVVPRNLCPLPNLCHWTGAAISASVPTPSLFSSNTARPPSHAAAFTNASIYPKSIEKVTEKGHARVSETLSPLVLPAREIKDLESRLYCRTVCTSVLRDAKGRVCVGTFLGSCRPSFFFKGATLILGCLNRWDRGQFFA